MPPPPDPARLPPPKHSPSSNGPRQNLRPTQLQHNIARAPPINRRQDTKVRPARNDHPQSIHPKTKSPDRLPPPAPAGRSLRAPPPRPASLPPHSGDCQRPDQPPPVATRLAP